MNTTSPDRKRSPVDLGIVDGLVQLSAVVQTVLAKATDRFDLTVLQGRLLGVLRDREPTMAQLRTLLDLDKSSTTGLVDRAERRGLVYRSPVPQDGRSCRVVLTDEGHRIAETLVAEVTAQVSLLTDDLSDTNRHRLSLLASAIVQRHAAEHGIDLSTAIAQRYGTPNNQRKVTISDNRQRGNRGDITTAR